jgi:ubiquinone/menaquinone biosynthesis C-methylase UbiE
MPTLRRIMRFFFHHFYHSFAWTYDSVAALVSVGRWNGWVQSVIPYVLGMNVLEIGHGPGYLQSLLLTEGWFTVGVDESPQMGRITKRRLEMAGQNKSNLTRALAESLPFASEIYDTVVATFPTEYIFNPQTLSAINRVLRNEGRFIVLPAAWIIGNRALDKCAAWLFKVTDQSPAVPHEEISDHIKHVFEEAGFTPEFRTLEIKSSVILIAIATKSKRI